MMNQSASIIGFPERPALVETVREEREEHSEWVECELSGRMVWAVKVKTNVHSVWVRLTDGKTVKRHRRRHLVREANAEERPPAALELVGGMERMGSMGGVNAR